MDDPSQTDEQTLSAMALPVATPPRLTILAGLPPATHQLRLGETVVGRSSEADVRLAHPEVSRRHCIFRWSSAQGCTVEDLGSHWGTRVNDVALETGEAVPLRPGDHLAIGPVAVFYGFSAPSAEEANLVLSHHGQSRVGKAKMLVGGQETDVIPLGAKRLCLGRGGEMDVVLADAGVSRQHAAIERTPTGHEISDLRSRAGSLVNGRRFEKHQLVIGDQLQIGPFFFRFDGLVLERTTDLHSVSIEAVRLTQTVPGGTTPILNDISLRIERSQFVMILGPSGAGKSSLLETLIGLRQADSGAILYDGEDFSRDPEGLRALVGHVPQDDIVHRELTPTQALDFSARLRLPAGTPDLEIQKLVAQTINRLGLGPRRDTPIHRLSGGERKRVNVGVELLDRPAVLFLDEPTSGLDPAGEFKMMELLRHLADSGCTVICTTHVVENVYLADRLFVMTGGRLAFAGTAQEARATFDVQKLTLLYDRLEERSPAEWSEIFQAQQDAQEAREDGQSSFAAWQARGRRPVERPPAALPVLLARQWTIMRADWQNFLLLFGQPLIIALLVARVTDDVALAMFFAYLSALWFGCSNAAQEIVREVAIYRRERMVGLGRHVYLLSKFVLWGGLTACQGLFLYACLWATRWVLYPDPGGGIARGIDGALAWNLGALVGTAFAAVGIGFAVSALARSTMQAVMAVPLVLIPQILFSGLVVETNQMSSPLVYALAQPMPSYAAQTMADVGAFIGRPVTGEIYNVHKKAGDHLKDLWLRELVAHPPQPDLTKGELRALAAQQFRIGEVYRRWDVGWIAAAKLLVWTLLGYLTAWLALRAKERR